MDNNNQAVETLSKQIIKAIRKICNTLPFDRTVEGKVVSKTSTGYLVSIEGSQVNVKGDFLNLNSNDIVKIHIPKNNINKAYIEDVVQFVSLRLNVYTLSIHVSSTNTFSFQSRFTALADNRNSRQTVKIFGSDNFTFIDGSLLVISDGSCTWSGTGTLTATMNSTGRVTVTLPATAYDRFVLISGEQMSS